MSKKEIVNLPKNPNHYYGTSIAVENLKIGDVFFYVPFNKPPHSEIYQMRIEAFAKSKKDSSYEIHTDAIVFIAESNTRLQLTNFPKL